MTEWINVKERLPESSKSILAYQPYGRHFFVGMYFNGRWFPPNGIQAPIVTHWMPLPKPPKGKP